MAKENFEDILILNTIAKLQQAQISINEQLHD